MSATPGSTPSADQGPRRRVPHGYRANNLIVLFVDVANAQEIARDLGETGLRDAMDQWERVLKFLAVQYSGFLIRRMGTSLLFSFSGSSGALVCATAIMEMIPDEGSRQPASPIFRIGMHAGDVSGIHSMECVKTAAKLVAVAGPGEIVLSGAALEALDPAARLRTAPCADPAKAALLVGTQTCVYLWRNASRPAPPTERAQADATLVSAAAPTAAPGQADAASAAGAPLPLPPEAVDAALSQVGLTPLAAEGPQGTPVSSPAPPQMTLIHDGRSHHLNADSPRLTIGRSPQADIILRTPMASRLHGWFELADGQFRYADQSTNGTFLYRGDDAAPVHLCHGSAAITGTGRLCPGCPSDHEHAELVFFKVGSVY